MGSRSVTLTGAGHPAPIFSMDTEKGKSGIFFMGMHGQDKWYPRWVYHKVHQPKIVNNTDEEEQARVEGFEAMGQIMTSNSSMQNWFWDLEDMSPKQLVVFAQDEFGVDLPIEAGQEKLFEIVCKLTKAAPQNYGRIALMAHTIHMNYDETVEQIKRGIAGGVTETFTEEFVA